MLLKVPSQAQNDAPLIKKANNTFQSGDFKGALNEYRQLLSKDPKNIDFNYKYATCLYHTSDINKATKFYDLILNMYEPPVDSYFYRGKIYQHNYDFQNAIKSFEKYKSLLGKKDIDLGADKEINYCKNAQNQLKNVGSIKTLKRYLANRRDFYQTYKLSNTAISFIPIDELFSKQNSKKNYKPLIASFRGMKYRFFASYGMDARTGKDIYVQKKNEKNEWDEPIKLGSEVNSLGDEDFPFFDEQNGILYFSSDGHNSIGGFDLFKVNFNLSESSASDRKNLNFPFCSPNDDLFLVPDLPSKNAYFASNRNGELNKVEVFLIELSDSTIPMITIPGKLADEVDPMNKNVQIDLISAFSNERFGPYYSDSEGNYLLAIPRSGIYTFKVKVSGSLIEFEKQVEIPTTNDAKKIEQKIIYSTKGTKENVEIITRLVDQDNLTPQLSLRKLKETANLQVNSGSLITNIQPLNKNTLKDLGYSDSDSSKAIEQLMDDLLDVELDIEKNLKFQEELVQQLEQNENEISTLKAKKESLNNEFTNAKNSSEKNKINSEIRTIDRNIQKIKKQNLVLSHEIDAIVKNKWISRDNYTEIKKISTQINDQLLNSNDKSIESIVSENKEKIKHLLDGNLGDKEKLVQQKENSLLQQEKGVAEKIANYNAQIANLNSEIKVQEQILKTDKNKKQQELVQSKIKELTQNRNLTEELLNEANYQLKIIKLTQSAIAENKELIQKIDARAEQKSTFSTNKPIQNFEIDALSLADEILEQELGMVDSIENNYQNDIVALEKIEDEKERYSSLKVREEKYQSELKQKIRDNLSDSEKDKLFEQIQLSENRLNEINENFNKLVSNEVSKSANPVSSNKSVVNDKVTQSENNSSQNEIAKSTNPVSSDKSVVNENGIQSENNSSQNEIAKSANPVSSDKSVVNENETQSENNSSQNEIAKTANPVSSDKSVVNENETKSENNSSQNEIVKSANPVSSDKSVVNENETKSENNSSQNEIVKSANQVSSDKSVVNENEIQSENNSSQNDIVKSANPVSSDKSVVNENETQTENNSSQNEIAKTANPVSSDKSVVNENETQTENNSSQNEIAKKQDSNVYKDLDSIRKKEIDAFKSYAENGSRLISIKKDELKNVKNENEKNKLIQEIAELENNNRIEYKQARRVEKTAILNQQFPELEIFTTNDLVGQATEIKLRELELDKKISSTTNRLEKDQLMKKKVELVSLRSVLEKNIEESKELTYFTPTLPEISEPLSDEESASLRLREEYQNYIIERINFNNLIEKLEKAQNNNRFLRELIQIKLSDSTDVELNPSIMNLASQLKSNEELLDNLEKEIENKLVTINSFESANRFEWLLKNNIQPAKRIERESNLTDIASNFSIGKNPKISIEKPLPINVNNPTGLVYRVQVGAFRKPISKDAFRDFAPVSGEVLKNGLTCYLAGYFNSSKSAISARKQIRSLGYVDAFIVAYCDGKRISFAQGRELEISGRCKSMSQDEMILALKQNNSPNEINSDRKINEYKSANYLNTPNARKAEIGEEQEHLFFTVQIGVYNKPISNNQLTEFSKLVTFKTDKGQIRYSSGMFDNLNAAKIHRKEAIASGIADAFIVAYYNGKRISIVEANNLISKNDPSIFQKVNKSISVNTNNSNSSKDSLVNLMFYLPEVKPSIKNDSIVQFSIECTKDEAISKLERLNRVGIFTYQPEKGKIVSSKMNWTNMSTIQREYLQDFKSENSNNPSLSIQLDITNKLWNGAFCDWLLRSNLSYYIESKDELKILNLYLENESERELVLKKANELLISVMN